VKSGSSKKKSKDLKDNKKGVLSDRLEEVAVFGGKNKVVSSQNFEGGEIVAVFGGNEVDLRPANVVEGGAELEVVCVFGGTEIKIPEDWDVEVDATSIFGAVKDERRVVGDLDSAKKIVLTGAVVFGGVVIKN
jgi:predicted membrane protein